MNTKKSIEEFLAQKTIAVAGVSRNKNKFGNQLYKELKKKNYNVYAVNPYIKEFEGDVCYSSVSELPEVPGSVVVCVSKENSFDSAVDTFSAGVRNIWFQTGSGSEKAVAFCSAKNMNVIHDECILMFAQPESFHKFHRWINNLFGKLPA